ncbi:MAG: magnesium transporter [bacterium]
MNEEKNKKQLEKNLHSLIKKGQKKDYIQLFKEQHEADIAEILSTFNQNEKQKFFQNVNIKLGADVLEELDQDAQLNLIKTLKTDLSAKFIKEMEPDDAVDLLEELQENDEAKAEEIIDALPTEEAQELQELLTYPENSAGAIMTTEFISIPEKLSCKSALETIKKQNPPDTDVAFYTFIVNEKKELTSFTTLRNILLANENNTIKSIRNDYPITAHINDDQEDVAKKFQKYNLVVIPVIDDTNILKGIITVDDIVDVVVEEATEDIYKLTGTSDNTETNLLSGSLQKSVFTRIPWLILSIIGGILSAIIITFYANIFKNQLFSLALSLSYIPLLTGLAGNIGNQSATIIVRSLATGKLKNTPVKKQLLREFQIGCLIGISIASLLLIINIFVFNTSYLFSCIVSLALICNMAVAAIIGTGLPLLFNHVNIDPAIAAAPFISTALDIIGQLIYFSLTLYILSFFI